MPCQSKRQRVEQFEQWCRRHGLPMTMQRRVVLEAVLSRDDHPTADQILDEVRRRLPSISRTTVYRVLETLVGAGVIMRICHPGSAARFDPKIHQHHHLVCAHCESVVDLEDRRLHGVPWPDVRRFGFEITEYHIHYRGVCRHCRTKLRGIADKPIRKRYERATAARRRQSTPPLPLRKRSKT